MQYATKSTIKINLMFITIIDCRTANINNTTTQDLYPTQNFSIPICPMNAVSMREARGSAVKANAAGNAICVISRPRLSGLRTLLTKQNMYKKVTKDSKFGSLEFKIGMLRKKTLRCGIVLLEKT